MTKLEELIKELCPNGVEYKTVGDVCDTITDYTAAGSFADIAKNVKYITDSIGFAQLVRTTDLKNSFSNNNRFVYVDEHAFRYLWRVNLNAEALIMPNVGNCGEVYYITEKIFPHEHNVLGPNAILVKSSFVNIRFLYHLFLTNEFQGSLAKIVSPAGQTKFNKTNFKEIKIPVPPIPVQEEIVRILDSFTELAAELTAELTARKKQYEYYRDSLLTISNEKIAMSRLDSIAKFTYGYTDKAKDSGSVRFIRITDISDNGTLNPNDAKFIDLTDESKKYLLHKGDIVMARTGATFGKTLYVPDDTPSVYASFLIKITLDNSKISNRFYWHFAQSNLYWEQANKLVSAGGQPQFNASAVGRVLVPVPPLETQNKIVQILDNFDSICSDLKIGLPAEIEARTKQYEYYRDKLLSFKETPTYEQKKEISKTE